MLFTFQQEPMVYEKMLLYFSWLFRHRMGVTVSSKLRDRSKVAAKDIVLFTFVDAEATVKVERFRGLRRWLLMAEPPHNWARLKKKKHTFEVVLTTQPGTVSALQKFFPKSRVFHLHQLYSPAVMQVPRRLVGTFKKMHDVCFPGMGACAMREQAVVELRKAGVSVCIDAAYGRGFDELVLKSKVAIYVPASEKYTTFAGQRLLYSVTLGVCTVGVKSKDRESEKFYEGCYMAVPDVNELVRTVSRVVRDGSWSTMGQKHLAEFRTKSLAVPAGLAQLLKPMAATPRPVPEVRRRQNIPINTNDFQVYKKKHELFARPDQRR